MLFVTASCNNSWYVLGGKRDERLILPTNGSVSVTLDLQHVYLHV